MCLGMSRESFFGRWLLTRFGKRPERWDCPPQEANAIPGLYSNILTFGNGNPINGNRACIGFKFALLESVRRSVVFLFL
jgi:hypothetical protein